MPGKLGQRLVSSDELIGNVVQVIAHDLRLRADPQNIVADTPDQRRPPARCDGAEGVPWVAGDKTEPGGLTAKLFLDIGVSLARRLVVLHAVRAESPFKQIDDAAMLELARLQFEQIVREGEEPKPCIAQLAERRRNLGVGWHRGKLLRELLLVLVIDLDA